MSTAFEIGTVVGGYAIDHCIAGMELRGLYRGHDELGRSVLISTSAHQSAPLAKVERDLAFTHEKITRVREIRRLDAQIDILVEAHPEGSPLSARVAQGPCASEIASAVVAELAQISLSCPHGLGGLRPELIFIDENASVAAIAPRFESFWRSARDVSIGLPIPFSRQYQPAERWSDRNPVTHAVDVYSLAMIFVELLTGVYPFGETDFATAIELILSGEIPEIPAVPTLLREILIQAFDRSPKRRPTLERLCSALTSRQ